MKASLQQQPMYCSRDHNYPSRLHRCFTAELGFGEKPLRDGHSFRLQLYIPLHGVHPLPLFGWPRCHNWSAAIYPQRLYLDTHNANLPRFWHREFAAISRWIRSNVISMVPFTHAAFFVVNSRQKSRNKKGSRAKKLHDKKITLCVSRCTIKKITLCVSRFLNLDTHSAIFLSHDFFALDPYLLHNFWLEFATKNAACVNWHT